MKGKLFQKSIKILAILIMAGLSANHAFAQTRSISGTVVDGQNLPVIGASVMVVGQSQTGTVTDLDGKFALNVPAGSTISVSCIGYETQTISVGTQSVINVVLKEDSEFLEETVVIGYGVQKKSDLTGSVASVKESDLANRSTVSAVQALQGKAAGVQIVNSSGAPGSEANIQIRGYSSNSKTTPLIIVDGLKVDSMNYLDPDNIESIEVLKDAASAAIYGIEAGNGVILITTKQGKTGGRGRVFYNFMSSTQSAANIPDIMNAADYCAYQTLLGNGSAAFWDGKTSTNFLDRMLEKGQTFRHTVGAEASTDRSSLYVSLTSIDDDGIIIGNSDILKRLSGQINAEHKINDWLTIGTNNNLQKSTLRTVSEQSGNASSLIGTILIYEPIVPWTYDMNNLPADIQAKVDLGLNLPKDPNGNIYGLSSQLTGTQGANPITQRDYYQNLTESFNLNGTTYANFTPFKGFVFTSRFGYRAGYSQSSNYNAPFAVSASGKTEMSLSATSRNSLFYQWENFANYSTNLGKHNLSAMAGFSFQANHSDYTSGTTYLLTDPAPNYRYLSYAQNDTRMSVGGVPSDRTQMSYFARLGWSYANKYTFQANFRADAYDTSKLDRSNRWGYFPSVSAGWTVSNEDFMLGVKDALKLTFMKLRASWGINGNVNALGDYQYTDVLSANTSNGYNFDDATARTVGMSPKGVLPNPSIKWETSRQVDLGLDMRFLNERLSIAVDWYNKNTNDLLTSTTAPANTGSSTTYINAGKVNNHGTEFEASWRDAIGDFSYSISGNLATLHNKVLEGTQVGRVAGSGIASAETVTYFEAGYPLWYLRLYEIDHVDQQTGNPIFKNNSGDPEGVINDDDRVMAGKGIPDFTYGITLTLAYKGFDIIAYGTGAQGVEKLLCLTAGNNTIANTLTEFYRDAWQSPSSTNFKHPRPVNDTRILASTDRMFDASFFKIKQLQLGYTVPKSLTSKIKMSNFRVYMSLDDWFTFTKYPGLDPEGGMYGRSTSGLAIDTGSYPISKKLVFGVNVSF